MMEIVKEIMNIQGKILLVVFLVFFVLPSIQCAISQPIEVTYEGVLTDVDIGKDKVSFTFEDGRVITAWDTLAHLPTELQLGEVYVITIRKSSTSPSERLGSLISIELAE